MTDILDEREKSLDAVSNSTSANPLLFVKYHPSLNDAHYSLSDRFASEMVIHF